MIISLWLGDKMCQYLDLCNLVLMLQGMEKSPFTKRLIFSWFWMNVVQ